MKDFLSGLDRRILEEKEAGAVIILAIDGPCASGKTTLGEKLSQKYACPLVHMDDFFLPFERRGESSVIASNIDQDLLEKQVFQSFAQGITAVYSPYSCKKGEYGEEIQIPASHLLIVEGVYSMLPRFRHYTKIKIFLTVSGDVQTERLLNRGSNLEAFQKVWIPREEFYFETCQVQECCDFVI